VSRKRGFVRASLLVVLLAVAIGWVSLLNLDLFGSGAGGGRAASDGSRAEVAWLDSRAEFPRVKIYLRVSDGAGQPIKELTQDAFGLTEDGIPVDIVEFMGAGEQTVSTMLVIDHSGSMDGDKIVGAREAARTFVGLMRPGKDQAGLIAFGSFVERLSGLTDDTALLQREITGINVTGNTAF
jgi:Mg-chelatase subunit ChlD